MIRSALAALALFAASACAPENGEPPAQPSPIETPQTAEEATAQDTCGAGRFQHLIGQPVSAIDQSALPPRTRILAPDAIMTQDFSPQRLNIFTGTDGRISSMRCF